MTMPCGIFSTRASTAAWLGFNILPEQPKRCSCSFGMSTITSLRSSWSTLRLPISCLLRGIVYRHPNLNQAGASHWIEFSAVALEIWRVHHFYARIRQPFVPDRVMRAPQHRHVFVMTEHSIVLCPNPNG